MSSEGDGGRMEGTGQRKKKIIESEGQHRPDLIEPVADMGRGFMYLLYIMLTLLGRISIFSDG